MFVEAQWPDQWVEREDLKGGGQWLWGTCQEDPATVVIAGCWASLPSHTPPWFALFGLEKEGGGGRCMVVARGKGDAYTNEWIWLEWEDWYSLWCQISEVWGGSYIATRLWCSLEGQDACVEELIVNKDWAIEMGIREQWK